MADVRLEVLRGRRGVRTPGPIIDVLDKLMERVMAAHDKCDLGDNTSCRAEEYGDGDVVDHKVLLNADKIRGLLFDYATHGYSIVWCRHGGAR